MDVHLKELFERFHLQFGSGPGLGPGSGTCLLKTDGISPNFIKSLFRAAAALYRTDPWKRLRPAHLLGIRVGKDSDWPGKKHPFPCVQFVGGDGGDLGFHMFRSENDALTMTGSIDTVKVPNLEVLRVNYEREGLMGLSNRRMVRALSLEASGTDRDRDRDGDGDRYPSVDVAFCTSKGEVRFRNPSVEELRFVYGFMKAVALVHPLLNEDKESVPKWSRLIAFEAFIETVDVEWPPEMARGWDIVAVTVSHPPGQAYDEKGTASTPTPTTKYGNEFVDVKLLNWGGVGMMMLMMMRQCAMCDKEVHSEQLVTCGRCRGLVYCGSACQRQHWKEAHKSSCGLYKAMMEREEELALNIFKFPCSIENPCKWLESVGLHQKGMWRRKCNCCSHCPFGLLPVKGGLSDSWGGLDDEEYPPDIPFHGLIRDGMSTPVLLSSWSEYYNLRSLPLSSPVAAILSYPLTVYYILMALNISSKNLLLKGKEVVVHYLGPQGELDWMPAFAEIGHLLNGLGNLQIVMVGPDVPTELSGTMSGISSRMRVNFVRGLYQEEATYLPSPHLVIALNGGLESYATWGDALDLIKSMNVPSFFTDQTELACSSAKQVLRGAGLHITHPMTPNPFRSPVRNQGPSSNLPSYINCFVLGVNT
ncbi:hypothetical protein Sjap_003226 [Stephania japonica]|uniref:MYND-type domain-containing protein n=1 Tax=Stephania japonica TaxID=461633 RepID=A0AAP0KNI4_9MAGN